MKKASIIVLSWYVAFAALCVIPAKKKVVVKKEILEKVKLVVKDEYVAEEIAKSKFPTQLAAIAAQENSKFAPLLKSDKGASVGLFMIQPKHHGEFALDVASQVKKAEEVHEWMIRAYGADLALQRHNGAGKMARIYHKQALTKIKVMQLHNPC